MTDLMCNNPLYTVEYDGDNFDNSPAALCLLNTQMSNVKQMKLGITFIKKSKAFKGILDSEAPTTH